MTFAWVMTRTAGPPAVRLAAPLYVGIALVAPVLFGGNGMSAHDAVSAMRTSPLLHAGLWLAWVAAAAPAARALFHAPGLSYLRALPVPRWRFAAVHALHLCVLESAWVLLHARGGGLGAAAFALATTASAHALLAHATAHRPRHTRPITRGPRVVALARAWQAAVWRRGGTAITRALLVAGAGAGAGVLAARNNGIAPGDVAPLALGTLAPFHFVALGGIRQRFALAERSAGWLLDATATTPTVRDVARALAATPWGLALGALHGLVLGAGVAAGPPAHIALTALCAACGAVLAALAAARTQVHP